MKTKLKVYSTLTIKAVNEEKRIIEGIASTPSTDRMDDIVEPKGAQFTLPIPLLWMHDSSQPVGEVTAAKVTNDGISITARFAKVDEPPSLKEDLDRAWAMVKAKLVRGLSIGFMPIESADIDGTWGRRFIKWDWYELSAVVIPANQDASITAIKSIDDEILSGGKTIADCKSRFPFLPTEAAPAHGHERRTSIVVKQQPSPGASGKPISTIPKGKTMKTIKEQIAALEATRAANAARIKAIADDAQAKGVTIGDGAEGEEFDTLSGEIESIDKDLVRLHKLDKINLEQLKEIPASVGTQPGRAVEVRHSGITHVKSNIEPGVRFARYAQALVRGNFNPMAVLQAIEADGVWMRSTPELAMIAKTAIPAADSTTSGWASELAYAQNMASEFIEYLRPMTILGRIPNFRPAPFNMRVGGLSSGTTGYWVGQGRAIPVSKGVSTSVTLAITKAAGLSAMTKELARLSTPSAELMIRDDLAKAVVETIDEAFINPNNSGVANEKPASIINGVTPVTPTGTTYAAMRTDIQTLMETSFDANLDTEGSVWIMSHSTALKLSMMVNALDQRVNPAMTAKGGEFQGYPVITSQRLQITGSPQYNDIIIFLHPREIYLADDGQVTLESSDQVSLELLDNPTNLSTGATQPTTVVSMFQTESIAIKAVRYINWAKRRATAAQWIQAALYTG